MYAWYQQIHQPTGIEQSLYCNFTSEDEKDLVVVAASQLTVYRMNKSCQAQGRNESSQDLQSKVRLEQLGSWRLFGNVVSLKSVSLPKSKFDALLLSFEEAKLSIVEFDVAAHDIKTVALHYFEESLHKDGLLQNLCLPNLSVDPDGRCASMQLSSNTVSIIPLNTGEVSSEDPILDNTDDPQQSSTHSATSYSIDLHKEVDPRLQKIIDFKFLYGYYEPTLLILFESLRTWSGRVAIRQDTANIVAISLNIAERLNPVIWSLNGLPFDCKQVYAVPKPIGGVLIFAVNSILYLNQSVPPYGTAMNSLTKNSTSFPLKAQEGTCVTLDCSNAAFISPESMVISLKTGELYILTLLVDSMRSVRNFHFDKAASSVLTTSITPMENSYLFLGSRLGNSLLLRYTKANSELTTDSPNNTEPATKRKRLNTAADWEATDRSDVDDLEMYGKDNVTSEPLSLYNFEVCDSLLNIGPCGYAELGEPVFLSEEFVNQRDTDLELVILSGYGKNGALSILQRTVKPQVVTTFELPGCIDMWTVMSKPKAVATEVENQHSYLILSREESTLVLETGKEIMEVEESGFNTRHSSVYIGNIGGDAKLILQVCETGVWLLDGVQLKQYLALDFDAPIIQCSVADPYVMLLTGDGQLVLLILKEDPESDDEGLRLFCTNPSVSQVPRISSVCLYLDKSGMFRTNHLKTPDPTVTSSSSTKGDASLYHNNVKPKTKPRATTPPPIAKGVAYTADEEDQLLYGESDPQIDFSTTLSAEKFPSDADKSPEPLAESSHRSNGDEKKYWCVVGRENRNLEIYSVPNFELLYMVKNFSFGHKLLVNSAMQSFGGDLEKGVSGAESRYADNPKIHEILLIGLGNKQSRPYLIARVGKDLFIYETFRHAPEKESKRAVLHIRFKKIHHSIVTRNCSNISEEQTAVHGKQLLRPFDNIAGYSGVFLCGAYPHWIVCSHRGTLYCHSMTVDGTVTCFVPFHNINCPHGFLYFNLMGELRICMLPQHMKYDNPWPARKESLKCTPHFIAYSIEHKVYALVTSVSEPCTRLPFTNCDNEREFEDLERDDQFIYPHVDKFSVQLISPVGWELIPNARVDMEEYEHVTCMKNAWLNPGPYTSVRQNYVVLGTTNVMGEEMGSRGKIIIMEIIEVVPEPDKPLTKNKLKQVYSSEQKGPVTAICGAQGNLLTAIGQKVFIWRFDENQSLRGLAFVDTNMYIHQAFSFRNFAVVADIQRSVTLLRYQDEYKTLSVVSRDVRPMEVYSANLLVDGTSVGFLASDHEKNIVLFNYLPEDHDSFGGTRLMRRADMHVGSHVNCMWRIGCSQFDRSTRTTNTTYGSSQVTMMGSLDGSMSFALPITEKIYRRLLMIQNAMVTGLQHTAGLNPKAYRQFVTQQRSLINPMKNILDGDLLWKFNNLSHIERHELAKKVGTTSDQILDDLVEIHRSACIM